MVTNEVSIMNGFNELVRVALAQKDMNMTQLAKETGYSLMHISDLIKGNRRWNETSIQRVCDVLGIEIHYSLKDKAS
jgi:transcriptional regulator with XRE-family HTH domain